jgi:hypothetical protein
MPEYRNKKEIQPELIPLPRLWAVAAGYADLIP